MVTFWLFPSPPSACLYFKRDDAFLTQHLIWFEAAETIVTCISETGNDERVYLSLSFPPQGTFRPLGRSWLLQSCLGPWVLWRLSLGCSVPKSEGKTTFWRGGSLRLEGCSFYCKVTMQKQVAHMENMFLEHLTNIPGEPVSKIKQ